MKNSYHKHKKVLKDLVENKRNKIFDQMERIVGLRRNKVKPKIFIKDESPQNVKTIDIETIPPGILYLKKELKRYKKIRKEYRDELNFEHKSIRFLNDNLENFIGNIENYIMDNFKKLWTKKIIKSDIFGRYYTNPGNEKIELYWELILSFAEVHNINFENLALVVLAHEIGHYMTHLGLDTSNHIWKTPLYNRAESKLVENIAQYYAEKCSREEKIDKEFYGLLKRQSEDYTTFKDDFCECSLEAVRLALVNIRRREEPNYKKFVNMIHVFQNSIDNINNINNVSSYNSQIKQAKNLNTKKDKISEDLPSALKEVIEMATNKPIIKNKKHKGH